MSGGSRNRIEVEDAAVDQQSHPNRARARPNNPFRIRVKNGGLHVRIADELHDAGWAAWFGSIQEALRLSRMGDEQFNRCLVDFQDCTWADPLPLLSLSISLLEFERNGGHVGIKLPPIPAEQDRNPLDPRHKLLRFLAREGFMDLLCRPAVISIPKQDAYREVARSVLECVESVKSPDSRRTTTSLDWTCTNEQVDRIKELNVPLIFERATCLPAKILMVGQVTPNSRTLEDIGDWVDLQLAKAIDPVVSDMVPGWAQGGVRYRLLTFLRECLHNVAEHAYTDGGFVAVYVRYREGRLSESPENWKRINKFLERESDQRKVPLLTPSHTPSAQTAAESRARPDAFENMRSGFFEVYILDAGKGLLKPLVDSGAAASSLSGVMHSIFLDGLSRKGKKRETKQGGLWLVRKLLEPVGDYLRVRDEDDWWGTELPLVVGQKGHLAGGAIAAKALGVECARIAVQGLAWTARLSWRERTDRSDEFEDTQWRGFIKDADKSARDRLLEVYHDAEGTRATTVPVFDQRFPQADHMAEQTSDLVVGLPRPDKSKRGIQDWIVQITSAKNQASAPAGIVVIGDIPSIEAAVYLAAIDGAQRFRSPELIHVTRAVLVTRDLRICVLTKKRGVLKYDAKETEAFLSSEEESVNGSCLAYFAYMRKHDGERFWATARQLPDALIAEKVDWHGNRTLDGYLDFSQTMTDPVCRQIYSVTLERLLALFARLDCKLVPIDILVDSFIARFRATHHPRFRQNDGSANGSGQVTLNIGSVMVTGHTANTQCMGSSYVFHFFRHASGTGVGRFMLPWLWRRDDKTVNANVLAIGYRRIGRSPIIAKGGWKAFSMPRFREDDETSIYGQSPKDSYRAWQEPSRPPLRIGHWSYGGHHDLLTINMLRAFDTELDQISLALDGSLARFTYANLFRIFDLRTEHLNESGAQLVEAIELDDYRNRFPQNMHARKPALIYPSHPTTDHIIDKFMSMIADHEKREYVQSRVIPILPLRRNRRGLGLQISGLVLERLQAVCRASDQPLLVYFDDALITGRTFAEIKSLAHRAGYEDVYSLILLDRQRFPSAQHVDGIHKLCFWRLDVPTLGSSARCPLCHAFKLVQDFKDSLIDTVHRERVTDWYNNWKEADPTVDWGDAGLKPIPLVLNKDKRRFGLVRRSSIAGRTQVEFEQAGGDEQLIRLSNSAGLATWMTELQSITARDDLYRKIIAEEPDIGVDTKIQLLCTQLLLFLREMEQPVEIELAKALLEALWEAAQSDRHTALAALTLICLEKEVLAQAIESFWTISSVRDFTGRNIDCLLILAYATRFLDLDSSRVPSTYEVARRLLKDENKLSLYYRLHRESKDALGKAHSEPLPRLLELAPDALLTPSEKKELSACVDYLTYVSEKLQGEWCRPIYAANADAGGAQIERIEWEGILETISRKGKLLSTKLLANAKNIEYVRDFKKDVQQFLANVDKLHQSVLYPLGVRELKSGKPGRLYSEIARLINECNHINPERELRLHASSGTTNEEYFSRLESELAEAYVPWDKDVCQAVTHVLRNIRHASKEKIADPWGRDNAGENSGVAHGWVTLNVQGNSITLTYRNLAEKTHKDRVGEVKGKWTAALLKRVGGTLCCRIIDASSIQMPARMRTVVETVIELPFIHTVT